MKNSNITSTHKFTESGSIYDIIAIDDSQYLLAAWRGVLRTTKDRVIKHYYHGKNVTSLFHITDSIYLVGLKENGLVVWNEETD